jgi:hypothetical protein
MQSSNGHLNAYQQRDLKNIQRTPATTVSKVRSLKVKNKKNYLALHKSKGLQIAQNYGVTNGI